MKKLQLSMGAAQPRLSGVSCSPMAQGGLVTVTIFNFINIWNEYFLSLMFVNSDKLRPVSFRAVLHD